MTLVKRGSTWWYDFYHKGTRYQASTRQTDKRKAKDVEDAAKAKLVIGIEEKKPVPTLREFIESRFEPWAKATFEKYSAKTWRDWYKPNLAAISAYEALSGRKLDQVTSEVAAEFAAYRQGKKLAVSSVNSSLRVLRRILRQAAAWGAIPAAPKLTFLRGEKHRDRVLNPIEMERYLTAAPEPLSSFAAVLADTGMRPEENFRLRWESLTWVNGRHGSLRVTHGKTKAARRVLPMTPRVRNILEVCWVNAGKPDDGWVWPAPTRSGHAEPSTFKKQHAKVFETLAEQAKENGEKAGLRFTFYDFRHTFLTRLAEAGCDTWTLAKIAGHSSIRMSERYVHPSEDAVFAALERLPHAIAGDSSGSPRQLRQ